MSISTLIFSLDDVIKKRDDGTGHLETKKYGNNHDRTGAEKFPGLTHGKTGRLVGQVVPAQGNGRQAGKDVAESTPAFKDRSGVMGNLLRANLQVKGKGNQDQAGAKDRPS